MEVNLITPKKLAENLSVNENTLAKWRLSGLGPKYIKVQRCVRYCQQDVKEWLDDQKFQSTTEAYNLRTFRACSI